MRILHFFKTYYPDTTGGIEQVIFQLCQGTRALGVENQVLTLSPDPHPARLKVADHDVMRVKENFNLASTGFSFEVFRQFKEMAAEADIVHFHFPWPWMDLVHFATRHNRPTVLSYHSDIIKQRSLLKVYRPLMNQFLKSMDRILVASPNYLRTSETLKPFADKTTVIPYGLDQAAYPTVSVVTQAQWRQRLPEKFFLFVGVLRYYKGLDSLLSALEGTGYPLVILGGGRRSRNSRHKPKSCSCVTCCSPGGWMTWTRFACCRCATRWCSRRTCAPKRLAFPWLKPRCTASR